MSKPPNSGPQKGGRCIKASRLRCLDEGGKLYAEQPSKVVLLVRGIVDMGGGLIALKSVDFNDVPCMGLPAGELARLLSSSLHEFFQKNS